MLKIRIAGKESELRQIAHKVGTTNIKRFKRDNGKTTFAIDVQISVKDFLENLNLNSDEESVTAEKNNADKNKENQHNKCDAQEITAELEDLLQHITDK